MPLTYTLLSRFGSETCFRRTEDEKLLLCIMEQVVSGFKIRLTSVVFEKFVAYSDNSYLFFSKDQQELFIQAFQIVK